MMSPAPACKNGGVWVGCWVRVIRSSNLREASARNKRVAEGCHPPKQEEVWWIGFVKLARKVRGCHISQLKRWYSCYSRQHKVVWAKKCYQRQLVEGRKGLEVVWCAARAHTIERHHSRINTQLQSGSLDPFNVNHFNFIFCSESGSSSNVLNFNEIFASVHAQKVVCEGNGTRARRWKC